MPLATKKNRTAFAGVTLPEGWFHVSPCLTTTRPRVFYKSKTTADNTTGEVFGMFSMINRPLLK